MEKTLYENSENIIEAFSFRNNENITRKFSDWYIPFGIRIKLKDFEGKFEYHIESERLKQDISSLSNIYLTLNGEYILHDMESDSFLKFLMINNGKMIFNGRLGSTHQPNYLTFEIEADQTFLKNMIEFLKTLV